MHIKLKAACLLATTVIVSIVTFYSPWVNAQNGNKVVVVPLGSDEQSSAANSVFTFSTVTAAVGGTVVQTLDVNLPASGHLLVTATWSHGFNDDEAAECSITVNSPAYDSQYSNVASADTIGAFVEIPGSVTGVYANLAAGNHTVRLICISTAGTTSVRRRALSAVYIPELL